MPLRKQPRQGVVLWVVLLSAFLLPQVDLAQITFQYFYDSRNQLARVIDSAGNVITYSYDEVGNILAITRTTVGSLPPPVISAVSPNQVNQSASVTLTITGTGLL